MGAFVEGVLHLRFQCNLFPRPFIVINLLRSKHLVLPMMNRLAWGVVPKCHLKGEVHMVPWGYSLSCNTPCVNPSTSGTFIIMCFLLKVFDFPGEAFHCSQDLFGRASGRFIIGFYLFLATFPLGLHPLLPMK
jgi:hypothetical protein